MMEKIDWYKEVLELEPNSRVFFPLARLLDNEGRSDEAIDVLKLGLERHPDFMEARLLLIELMYRKGDETACAIQIEQLSSMFAKYAGFWQAWAACLAKCPGEADTASIIRFLAAHFLAGPLQIHEILNRGIADILKSGSSSTVHINNLSSCEDMKSLNEDQNAIQLTDNDAISPGKEILEDKTPSTGAAVDLSSYMPAGKEEEALADPVIELSETLTDLSPEPEIDNSGEDDGRDNMPAPEIISVRTRSMAEVLADQGDYQGALDIYRELQSTETETLELENIHNRIAELEKLAQPALTNLELPSPTQKKEKLLGILEALAKRVEARIQN